MSLNLREINDALNGQLMNAAITQQIAWPNSTFTPQKGVSYLQVQSAGRSRAPLGFGADSAQQWTGTLQVSVFVSRDSGTRTQDEIAQQVLDAFPRGLNLPTTNGSTVTVEYSSADAPVEFGDWSNLPVMVHWFATVA